MKQLSQWIVKYRRVILVLFFSAAIVSMLTLPLVKINYDQSRYLPSEMKTQKSLTVLRESFGREGSAQVMVSGVNLIEALEWKSQISAIEGVKQVIWLDDAVDVQQPLHFIPDSALSSWYAEGNALYEVSFVEDDYSRITEQAIDRIRQLDSSRIAMRGPAIDALSTRKVASSEVGRIMFWIIPILLLILLLGTRSWLEPFLFMVTIGISVVMNLGTNFIFPDISYLTQTVAGILQLAIAMDYSIFLLHRYREERLAITNPAEAMKKALVKTFSSIAGSSLTTVASFTVLMMMRYRIGLDLGIVLVKGILLSLLAVVFLLPVLTMLMDTWLQKTTHRPLLPSMAFLSRGILRIKGMACILFFVLLIPLFLAQRSNHFLYGEASASADLSTLTGKETAAIESIFGRYNPVVLLVPSGSYGKENQLSTQLQSLDGMARVQALSTLVDPTIPRHMLPASLRNVFEQKGFARMVLMLDTAVESPEVFVLIDKIKEETQAYYGNEYHLVGASSSISDIREVVEQDFVRINWASIIVIALILLLLFRSFIIPLILVFVIEAAIWFNMAIPYFASQPLIFIGYMIVNTVQLGATIDYAILLTSRYREKRQHMDKKEAIKEALTGSGMSIIIAAMIVAAAGICLALVSEITGVSSIGLLIGRGAMISSLLVLVVLPQLLLWADPWIKKSYFSFSKTERSQ